jgi:sucrose-6-phosphate hydrolase SacC (GH32 family)
VYHEGKYHLYYQYNPFGIVWGNMHWGHFESKDLIHWVEQPIALFQHTTKDMAFSGGGFVDFNDSAGLGKTRNSPLSPAPGAANASLTARTAD